MRLQNIRLYDGNKQDGLFYAVGGLLIIGKEQTEISVESIDFEAKTLKTEIRFSNGQLLVYIGVPVSYEDTHLQILKRIKFLWEKMQKMIKDLRGEDRAGDLQ